MLVLRSSTASPFGRKVRMAIEVLGQGAQVRIENADTTGPTDSLRSQNPLGKIPTLLLESGEALYDSRVIVEYLNELDGQNRLIPAGRERIEVLREQALGDGLLDAALLQVYEQRFRPATHQVESWLEHQRGKVDRALSSFSARPPRRTAGGTGIGEITLAAALGYLDFRLEGAWRSTCPALVHWLNEFASRTPAYALTVP